MIVFIINIIGPVFLLLLAGFSAVKFRVLTDNAIDGLMRFAMHIAVPCLLFRATSTIDLASAYDWRLIVSYFGTAIFCFGLAIGLTRTMFGRRPGEAVAVSFGNLYANLVLIGSPIAERAFGIEALAFAVALISINAPISYLVGISVMEGVRADGRSLPDTGVIVVKTMFQNSLMIGILLGFIVNLSGIGLPVMLTDAIDMFKSAALPCALFALGGVLTRYSLSSEISEASLLSAISLLVQPLLAFVVCTMLGLDGLNRDVVVIMSAMPAGLNAFMFATLYSRGVGTAANTVLLATVMSVASISAWLLILVRIS